MLLQFVQSHAKFFMRFQRIGRQIAHFAHFAKDLYIHIRTPL